MAQRLASIRLPVQIMKQKNRYIAYTPLLDLSTSGRSEIEAKKRFADIVDIFFEEIIEAGTLNSVLAGLGWQKIAKNWQPPQIISQNSINLKIPALA